MRTKMIMSVLVLGGSLVSADAAMAQIGGPPKQSLSQAVILPADSAAQLYDLGRRLQRLEQQLSWRTDDTAKLQLAQVKALQDKVLGEIPPTADEFNRISVEISRLENLVR